MVVWVQTEQLVLVYDTHSKSQWLVCWNENAIYIKSIYDQVQREKSRQLVGLSDDGITTTKVCSWKIKKEIVFTLFHFLNVLQKIHENNQICHCVTCLSLLCLRAYNIKCDYHRSFHVTFFGSSQELSYNQSGRILLSNVVIFKVW